MQTAVAEGYQNLATMLALSLDMHFFADPVAPRFIDVLTPFRPDRRWGGDNTDCYYGYAVVDPRRTYRVSGLPNDSAMYSLTVYNEPEPGAWPNRTVGLLYDTDMPLDDDGRFSCVLGPTRPTGYDGPFIELSEDARGILTRDYHEHPETGRRVDWDIEVIDHAGLPVTPLKSDAAVATSLRAALRFAQDMYALIPLILPERQPVELADGQSLTTNTLAPPYRAGGATLRVLDAGRRAIAWAASRWNPVRHWSSPRSIRSAGSGISPCGTSSWPPSMSNTAGPDSIPAPRYPTATGRSPS